MVDIDVVVKQRCEICGAVFIEEYGFSLVTCWLVTGYHQGVLAYDCTTEHAPGQSRQHWGCTPEHAIQALNNCLQKGPMSIENLLEKHRQASEDGHPKVAPYFQSMYDEKGENFHILKEGDTHAN